MSRDAYVVRHSAGRAFSEEGFSVAQGLSLEGWRPEQLWLGIFRTEPGVQIPRHHHLTETAAYLIRGRAAFTVGGERMELDAGDWFHLGANVPHTEETVGDEIAEFVFVTDVRGLTPVFEREGNS